MNDPSNYLESALKEFRRYKALGDKSFAQLGEKDIHWSPNEDSNSIAIIVKHMVGNMRSRWTDFFSSDGEKSWRNRDTEFEDPFNSLLEMTEAWDRAWELVLNTLASIDPDSFNHKVYIRKEEHSVIEAVNRQLGHYAYHTGQIVYIAKSILGDKWQSLSIPKGGSDEYNKRMFGKDSPPKI